jgi:hypothetical protein
MTKITMRGEREELAAALEQFHYLGSGGGTVGENLQYRVCQGDGRLLAGLWFGSAAWKCGDRDRFIGWTAAQREANLWRITNNVRASKFSKKNRRRNGSDVPLATPYQSSWRPRR